jgi:protein-disulfide isomerase
MPSKKTTPSKAPVAAVSKKVSESDNSGSCRSGGCSGFGIWLAIFVVVVAQVVSTAYFSDLSVKKNLEAVKSFEYEKMGGKETFELLNKAQRLQIKGQLEQIKSFVEQSEKTAPSTSTGEVSSTGSEVSATPTDSKTMSKEDIAAIEKVAYFDGDAKSRIIVAEYTDPECPFCIRQAKDGIMPKLLESYAGKVRVAHKPFRAVPHPGAEPKAIALLCVGKIAGAETYNAYYDAMMDRSTQEKVMPVDSLASLAKELKVDAKEFSACYDAKETLAQYDANTTEGRKYGVEGTPGTLIIDSETGNYELIAGAYPYESFQAAVDKLLK